MIESRDHVLRLAVLLGAISAAVAACVPGPTFEEVYPIFERRCASCHVDSVETLKPHITDYQTAWSLQYRIRDSVAFREMPPFGLDNTTACGGNYFADEGMSLSDDEIQTITTWVDDGAPAGDLTKLRPGMGYVGPSLRSVGTTLSPPAYQVDGTNTHSLHRCFVVDPAITASTFLTAFEVVPGQPASVSGVALYALDDAAQLTAADQLDALDPAPGYPCFGSSRIDRARFLGTWVWGRPVVRLPEGTGLRLGAGTRIVVQITYNAQTIGFRPVVDTSRVDLELTSDVREASFVSVAALGFLLRPGVKAAEVHGYAEVTSGIEVLGVVPTMHELGHDLQLDRVRPFSTTCMARVPFWDHDNHQRLYQYFTRPPEVLPGDRLSLRCNFQTESRTDPISQGDDETQEQCAVNLYTVPAP